MTAEEASSHVGTAAPAVQPRSSAGVSSGLIAEYRERTKHASRTCPWKSGASAQRQSKKQLWAFSPCGYSRPQYPIPASIILKLETRNQKPYLFFGKYFFS